MSRTRIDCTENYQLIATKKCVITVLNVPAEDTPLYINSVDDDDNVATIDRPNSSDQYLQNSISSLYAKGIGYTLLIDEEA